MSFHEERKERSMNVTLIGSALLLWVPYTLAALYECYCKSFVIEDEFGVYVDSADRVVKTVSSLPIVKSAGALFGANVNNVRLGHSYHRLYYLVFPEGFDVAIFIPLVTRVLLFSSAAILVTYALVRVRRGGELLMMVAWMLGVLSPWGWMTESDLSTTHPLLHSITQRGGEGSQSAFPRIPTTNNSTTMNMNISSSGTSVPPFMLREVVPQAPPSMWLIVSLVTGFFSGILCKVKDSMEGKHLQSNQVIASSPSSKDGNKKNIVLSILQRRNQYRLIGIGDRMYMVVPFCTGQWFSFIVKNGWRGIIIANGTIVLSLGMIGYTMVSYQLIRSQILKVSAKRNTKRTVRTLVKVNKQGNQQSGENNTTTTSTTNANGDNSNDNNNKNSNNDNNNNSNNSTNERKGDALLDKLNESLRSEENKESRRREAMKEDSSSAAEDDDIEEEEEEEEEEYEEVITTIVEESPEVDLIDLFSKLCTTSFGAAFASIVAVNVFVTSLAIPFFRALFHLNALTSGVGIVVELIMYEVA